MEEEKKRGVKAGTKRGKYKKKRKPAKKVELIPLEQIPLHIEALKPKHRVRKPLSEQKYDEQGNPIPRPNTQFQKGVVHEHKPSGRPKGSRNRSSIVREILQAVKWGKNPLTGVDGYIPMEYQMTLAILQKAMKGDVNAYNALMNNSYKPHAQETENKHVQVDLTQFTPEELKGFLKDDDEE